MENTTKLIQPTIVDTQQDNIHTISYSDALKHGNTTLESNIEGKLNRLSSHIEILVQQMSTLMSLLTTVITKLCK